MRRERSVSIIHCPWLHHSPRGTNAELQSLVEFYVIFVIFLGQKTPYSLACNLTCVFHIIPPFLFSFFRYFSKSANRTWATLQGYAEIIRSSNKSAQTRRTCLRSRQHTIGAMSRAVITTFNNCISQDQISCYCR